MQNYSCTFYYLNLAYLFPIIFAMVCLVCFFFFRSCFHSKLQLHIFRHKNNITNAPIKFIDSNMLKVVVRRMLWHLFNLAHSKIGEIKLNAEKQLTKILTILMKFYIFSMVFVFARCKLFFCTV